jgi:serine protease Do
VVGVANAAGPIMPGDVIVAVNQVRFTTLEEFNKLVAQAKKGDSLALLVRRGEAAVYVPMPVDKASG